MVTRKIVAVLLALLALSQNASPSAGQAQTRSPEEKPAYQHDAQPQQRGTDQSPFVVQILPAPKINEKLVERASNQPDKSFEDWTAADIIAGIAAVASVLQAIALIATILVLVRTARRQLRAYVLPEGGRIMDGTMTTPPLPAHANEPGVILIFKNSGPTPAYNYVSWGQVVVTQPLNIPNLAIPSMAAAMYPAVVGAGGKMPKNLQLGRSLTQQEIADIGNGQQVVIAHGRIEYRDAFRRKRWTNFRLQYSGLWPPRHDAVLNFSAAGNDAN